MIYCFSLPDFIEVNHCIARTLINLFENGQQVAQLLDNGELVGVVRGCIKHVGTGFGGTHVMGCILGLRVSPTHRYYPLFLPIEWNLK